MWVFLSSGQGEAGASTGRWVPPLRRSRGASGDRVSVRRVVSLIFAGWLPHDAVSGGRSGACLRSSVARKRAAHSPIAGLLLTLRPQMLWIARERGLWGYASSVARDQHQPASSLAIAVFATV